MTTEQLNRSVSRARAIIIANRQDQKKLGFLRGLRGCRERAGLTQTEAANRTAVPRCSYVQWEQGRYWPSAGILPQLARALGVSIDELFLGPDEPGEGEP